MGNESLRIAVVGGGGHVGLPLSLLLAKKGFSVMIIDSDQGKIEGLKRGEFPFLEDGGVEALRELKDSSLVFTTQCEKVADADVVILTVSTPVDEHLNPNLTPVYAAMDQIKPYLHNGQVLLLRSTLFPGTSEKIHSLLNTAGLKIGIAFCPERIAQGKALKELQELPQIVSGSDEVALAVAKRIFSTITSEIIELGMKEAELAKLFSNAWRYIKFAVANQFYISAVEKGLDFHRIRKAMMLSYERAADFPTAGFTAGPCLFKDTMQLAAYCRQNFPLGHSAMLINETLPDFLVERIKQEQSLAGIRVGILGMAFKADSDDNRESLSYKLKKLLQYEGAIVMCSDPYVQDQSFHPVETILKSCPIIFIGCPHSVYRDIKFGDQRIIDCWRITSVNTLARCIP